MMSAKEVKALKNFMLPEPSHYDIKAITLSRSSTLKSN